MTGQEAYINWENSKDQELDAAARLVRDDLERFHSSGITHENAGEALATLSKYKDRLIEGISLTENQRIQELILLAEQQQNHSDMTDEKQLDLPL